MPLSPSILTSAFLLLGIVASLAQGTLLHLSEYRFAGTLHPNCQAVNCAALSLSALALYRDPRQQTSRLTARVLLALFALGTLFLFLTKSRTGTVAYLLVLIPFLTMGLSLKRKLLILSCAAVLAMTCVLAFFAFQPVDRSGNLFVAAATMGRDQDADDVKSLTGRIPIWEVILRDVTERPMLGYGYGAFWTPHRITEYSYVHNWEFAHAHSAYFETLLNVGFIGLVLGLLLVMRVVRAAERAYRATADCGYRFAAAMLIMALIHGFLDANFVNIGVESVLALICITVIVCHSRPEAGDKPASDSPGELHSTNWQKVYA